MNLATRPDDDLSTRADLAAQAAAAARDVALADIVSGASRTGLEPASG